ncbi:MAG: hypothetical protein AABZ39_02070 [Spirochaetota bacterium]
MELPHVIRANDTELRAYLMHSFIGCLSESKYEWNDIYQDKDGNFRVLKVLLEWDEVMYVRIASGDDIEKAKQNRRETDDFGRKRDLSR